MTSGFFLNHHLNFKNLVFLVLSAFCLTGCVQLYGPEQPAITGWDALSTDHTIGQTFVANYNGLTGIYFYFSPQTHGNGEIVLHLRSDPQALEDVAVSMNILPIEAVTSPGYYGFFVPAQMLSNQQYYYAFLDVRGSGKLQVGKTVGDAYLNGAFYQNGIPEDSQAAFKLSYSRRVAILGLGLEVVRLGGLLTVGIFLFILPGWGLFSLLWSGWRRTRWPEKICLSAGLSVALYPLILLWTNIIGLHLGAAYAWLPPLSGLGMVLWGSKKRTSVSPLKDFHPDTFKRDNLSLLPDIIFLFSLGLLIYTRFWVIRSLDVPMWGDLYQHTMISQLIVDHGGLFASWQPYADMTTFTYHFGFHSAVAVFTWITHLDMPKAVLWVGQFLNILAVIVLYPLAIKVGRNHWAGVVAVVVAGFLSQMPMFYVNWGRYTQLSGQVILPIAVWVIWNAFLQPPMASQQKPLQGKWESVGMLVLGCVALGGLALTHYRVMIIGIIFIAILWILYARRETVKFMIAKILFIGSGAFLLFLPWFIHVFGGKIIQIFTNQMTTTAADAFESDPQIAGIGNIFLYLPCIFWVMLLVVIGIGFWRKEKGAILTGLWWFACLLAGNPYWLGLPGTGVINSFTILIAVYIPASLLLGAAASWLGEFRTTKQDLKKNIRLSFSLGATLILLGTSIWGALQRINEVQPAQYALVTRPDVLAARWIVENTPAEEKLLVNSFPAYSNSLVVGSDGGWWLPLLTGRQNTVPPINYVFEKDPWPGYLEQVNSLTFAIREKGILDRDVTLMLKDRGISYVYVGQLQGSVNSGGPLFTVEQLLDDPVFYPIYHQDRVWIFKIQ